MATATLPPVGSFQYSILCCEWIDLYFAVPAQCPQCNDQFIINGSH